MRKFNILLANNNRSKAYLQCLTANNLIPNGAVYLDTSGYKLPENTEADHLFTSKSNQSLIRRVKEFNLEFNEKEHVLTTLHKYKICTQTIKSLDVNSPEVVNAVSCLTNDPVIYSGPGGTILKKEILSLGKPFIHAHPGWLPNYRGSTTIYYSLLSEGFIGCSIIQFRLGIDEGPVLLRRTFKICEQNLDIDYVLDPLVRTRTLLDYMQNSDVRILKQEDLEEPCTYYIIHPVLKHLSILKYNQE